MTKIIEILIWHISFLEMHILYASRCVCLFLSPIVHKHKKSLYKKLVNREEM